MILPIFSASLLWLVIITVLGWSSAISGSRPPNFFCEVGGPTFGGRRPSKVGIRVAKARAVYEKLENLKIFEKFRLENAIKMDFGDLLN